MMLPPTPHVYACIIITQDDDGICPNGRGGSRYDLRIFHNFYTFSYFFRLSDLPSYDEAVAQLVANGSCGDQSPTIEQRNVGTENFVLTVVDAGDRSTNAEKTAGQMDDSTTSKLPESCSYEKEENPPTYGEALAMIRNRSVIGPSSSRETSKSQQDPRVLPDTNV